MYKDESGYEVYEEIVCDRCHSLEMECAWSDVCQRCCHCEPNCWYFFNVPHDGEGKNFDDDEPSLTNLETMVSNESPKELTGLELAGHITVDSGQIIVGDPCYLKVWDGNENEPFSIDGQQGQYSYLGSCEATLSEDGFGTLNLGFAVALSSGYGDGNYPVYVKKNDHGKIALAIIDFTNEYLVDEES
jgi:hypothetical protein